MGSDLKLLDAAGHHAPDFNRLTLFGHDVRKSGIGCLELDAPGTLVKMLDGEVAIDDGHDHMVVAGFDGPVHHDDVVVKYPGLDHRVAAGTHEIGGLWVHHQNLGQINALSTQILCG